jgi:hypothetical protein
LIPLFKQAFPRPDLSLWGKLRVSLLEGLGVALLFWVFQPFGLGNIEGHPAFPTAYGAIVFAFTAMYRCIFPLFFPVYFLEKNWTVGREILGIMGILIGITAGILLFHESYYGKDFAHPLTVFFLVVFVGSIPVTISVLSRFAFLYRRYSGPHIPVQVTPVPDFNLVAENGKDFYSVQGLLFVEITDNYATLVYFDGHTLRRELMRSSLSKLELQVEGTSLVRCHRSYLVNLDRVVKVSGNAQGYKLHFHSTDETVPVSRKYAGQVVRDPKSLDVRPKGR